MAKSLLVGNDAEFMVYDSSGRLTSAITLLPENGKNNKLPVGKKSLGGFVFYDNVQLEINLNPAHSADELIENLRSIFYEIKKLIYPYAFVPQASATFPENQLQHQDSRVFGCDPEYCAYSLQIVKAPTSINGFRSAGGHIHLGQSEGESPLNIPPGEDDITVERDWGRLSVIRMMDLIVGLTSVILDKDPTSPARRQLYGSPGYHRTKPYGVEYRSIGNFWLNDPVLATMIFNLSKLAVNSVIDGQYRHYWPDNNITSCKYPVSKVCEAIKTADVELAKELIEKYVKPLLSKKTYLELVTVCDRPCNRNFYRNWEI